MKIENHILHYKNVKTVLAEGNKLLSEIFSLAEKSNDEAIGFITHLIDRADSEYNWEVLRVVLSNVKVKNIIKGNTNFLALKKV